MTTKEQERAAVEQIRKIIEGLGADSYVAAAMEGVLEVAEENINDDAMYSMKDRAERAYKDMNAMAAKLKTTEERVMQLQNILEDTRKELSERRTECIKLRMNCIDREDLTNIVKMYKDRQSEKARNAAESMAMAVISGDEAARDFAMRYRDAQLQVDRAVELEERLEEYR